MIAGLMPYYLLSTCSC